MPLIFEWRRVLVALFVPSLLPVDFVGCDRQWCKPSANTDWLAWPGDWYCVRQPNTFIDCEKYDNISSEERRAWTIFVTGWELTSSCYEDWSDSLTSMITVLFWGRATWPGYSCNIVHWLLTQSVQLLLIEIATVVALFVKIRLISKYGVSTLHRGLLSGEPCRTYGSICVHRKKTFCSRESISSLHTMVLFLKVPVYRSGNVPNYPAAY